MSRIAILAASVLTFGLGAMAQEIEPASAPTPPPPPCSQDEFKQFDFWLGDWEVTTPNGVVVGVNKITRQEAGCLILETWKSANGGTGQSYNYYNPATEKWRQVWVSAGLLIDYEGGLTDAGSMKLTGTVTYTTSNLEADFTGEWTPNEDGTVTQHFEQFDAETGEWNPWFTGAYTRIEPEAP